MFYLNSSLRQLKTKSQFFSDENVGIVRLKEEFLHCAKLLWRKRRPIASLEGKLTEHILDYQGCLNFFIRRTAQDLVCDQNCSLKEKQSLLRKFIMACFGKY